MVFFISKYKAIFKLRGFDFISYIYIQTQTNLALMSQFLWLGFTIKCNKIRQQAYGVMGGTPLRDGRGGRLP